jgi:hypothetical protein
MNGYDYGASLQVLTKKKKRLVHGNRGNVAKKKKPTYMHVPIPVYLKIEFLSSFLTTHLDYELMLSATFETSN